MKLPVKTAPRYIYLNPQGDTSQTMPRKEELASDLIDDYYIIPIKMHYWFRRNTPLINSLRPSNAYMRQ